MKICHVISSIDKKGGGTSTYLQQLSNELIKHVETNIVTLKCNEPIAINKKVEITSVNSSFPYSLGYSKELKETFVNYDFDIFHGNGLWQFPVHAMANAAFKRNIPYIISAHGMLEPWALNNSKWKKKLAFTFFQQNDLARANCIHATAEMEADNIRKLGFKNPIAIIPNGIDLRELSVLEQKKTTTKRKLLYLSRVHPKKGIELLVEAWALLDKKLRLNWQVDITGNGEESYISNLKELIKSKGLINDFKFTGPLYGNSKLNALQQADLFILPTYSENFGIVVAEALACGIPVITTKGTPWEELNSCHAGWWIDRGIEPLLLALEKAMKLTNKERQLIGTNGRKLVETNYSIEAVGTQMLELYNWLLGRIQKPAFIH